MHPLAHPTYPPTYSAYFDALSGEWRSVLERQHQAFATWPQHLSPAQAQHRYAPGKWTVAQVIGHMADTERVFSFRALVFGRGDAAPLPGFDEEAYVAAAGFEALPLAQVLQQMQATRAHTLSLLEGMPAEALGRLGSANGKTVSVEALFAFMAAHVAHHGRVLQERYGIALPL